MAGDASASITGPTPKYPQSTGLVCGKWGTAPRGEIGAEYAGVDEIARGIAGRFIPLGDGQFLALTEAFRERLQEMRAFSEKSGDGLRFHPFAAPILSELTEEVGQLKADKRWRDNLQRFHESQDFTPEVPSTLQAELRDYQLEGFRWLARLAQWGGAVWR